MLDQAGPGSLVAFRGISGVQPLWRAANPLPGRFNTAGRRPTQYLCLHPQGPMAELLRHQPLAAAAPDQVRRSIFVVRLGMPLLAVSFAAARRLGITAAALVGDDYAPCQAWVEELLERRPGLAGIRVPSAALPGTDNVVLFGPATPIGYDSLPRRPEYLPCAVVAVDGRPPADLDAEVHPVGAARPHPALAAFLGARS
ncbi:MAG: RES family NAD+ phosphorylase [Candidatus Dormibacteria bacterium]